MPRTELPDTEPVLVLLAAGRGTRMGAPKLLLEHEGRPWLDRQLQGFADAGGRRALVITGPSSPGLDQDQPWLPREGQWTRRGDLRLGRCCNPRPERGMFSSLWCALGHLPGRELLVQPVDVPLPGPDTLAALCTAPLDPEDCLQPGRLCRRGHPVRLGHQLAARVACLDPEDTNLRLDHALARLARHRHLLPTHDPRPFMNLNTPEHWQEFLTLFPTRS